ncbi:MAG: MFS transporter [Streptosporangiaceae bacterium]|nr:MFS transporter [Streptosporangiaceae bacterium]
MSSRFVLPVVLAGTFMAILDVSIVVVAIPSIRMDLRAGYGAAEFVISAYTLTYASLLVTGGRLGDRFGRRRMFIVGLLGFTGSSALCGAAPSIGVLIGARALQGIGGALMFPQVLAIIQVTFGGQARTRALGVFGSVIGIAAVAGQLVGGVLLALNVFGLTWRPLFLVNVPLGAAAALAAARVLPRDPPDAHTRLDLGGAGLIAITQLLLTLPLLEGREHGWPAWMLGCLAASAPCLALFVAYEQRLAARGGAPLVPLRLFRDRGFAGGVPIALLFQASYTIFALTLSIYLQAGLGFSPLRAGAVYTPDAIGFFITSLTAPRLVPLLGRHVLSTGYVIASLGLLAAAATAAAAGSGLAGWELAAPLFIAGLGQGLGMSPMVGTIIAGLEPADAGTGAGVVTMTLQTGNVLGVGAGSLLFFTLAGSGLHGAAYAHAYALVLPVSAALLLLAAAGVHWLPVTPFEAQNALIERLPGWATGFAYSMFLMTGGRIGDRLFADVLSHITERRLRRTGEAPEDPGEFFAYHFDAMGEDGAWLNYLEREALTYGTGPIPHEHERLPVIQAQVDEIRRRQNAGLIDPRLDPRLVRLLGFALASYPRLLPQITRMTTGTPPGDPRFIAEWETFVRALGKRLAGPPQTGHT